MEYLYFALALLTLFGLLALCYVPFGGYMAKVFTSEKDWRIESLIYRLIGVDSKSEQSWKGYLRAVLLFSFAGILLLYGLQRLQGLLPLSNGLPGVKSVVAFNTAISFVSNTNWQVYSGEDTMGFLVQFAGLTVQNFVSAATGIAVAIALVRGFVYVKRGTIGNFWVDLTRSVIRILMPIAFLSALVLVAGGVVQNFHFFTEAHTIGGITQNIPGGPVASQESIKELGTNGGGFFNANASHPFENPTPWTSLLECFLILLIPVSLTRTFGVMVGNARQGLSILGAMIALYLLSTSLLIVAEVNGAGTALRAAGGAMEGKEQRFGIASSVLYASATTVTSTGSVNSMHDSYTALGGMSLILNMLLGEIAPGGVGAGLYGILIVAIIAVFIAGLLVGRTPEYLGKKIGPREMKLSALYILVMPVLVLAGVALSFGVSFIEKSVLGSLNNTGPHGLSEVIYAFASGVNNNGSAFAGLGAATPWLSLSIGVGMILGRFIPIILVLALAGSLAEQKRVPVTAGTLSTTGPLFSGLVVGVALLITALVFFPIFTLGPLAEGLV